jgi:hypothetical protein
VNCQLRCCKVQRGVRVEEEGLGLKVYEKIIVIYGVSTGMRFSKVLHELLY